MAVFLCAVIGVLCVLALAVRISGSHHSPGFGDPPRDLGPKGGSTSKYPNQDNRQ